MLVDPRELARKFVRPTDSVCFSAEMPINPAQFPPVLTGRFEALE